MSVVSTVQEVGVGLGLRSGLSLPLAVVGKGGANGEGSLAGVVDLGVEGGGAKDGGDLMDGSLQLTVVTSNGLVASNSNGDGGVGGNNVGLDGGGDGLVGDGLGGGDNGRGSIGVGSVGVGSDNDLRVGLSLPLAVVAVAVGVSISVSVAKTMAVVSTVQEVRVSISL